MTFDLALSEEQAAVKDLVDSLAVDVLSPAARSAEASQGITELLWGTLLSTGLTAPVPAEYGGGDVPDEISQLLAIEGLAYGDAAITAAAFWSGNVALVMGRNGSAEQRAAVLPAFVRDATLRAALAVYEGFGRAPSEYQTTIQPEGNGWRIAGRKIGVPLTANGGPLVVIGTDPTAGGRLRAALIPADRLAAEGMDIVAGSPYLGLDAVPLSTITFDVPIESADLLGGPDADPVTLAHSLSLVRLTNAALAVGCAHRAYDYASNYATERIAFGKPIASFQGVAFMMADAHIRVEAARLQLWETATALDGMDPARAERSVSEALAYITTVASEVTRDSIQVLGGHGFLADHPVELWYRAAAGLATLDFDPTCLAFAPAL